MVVETRQKAFGSTSRTQRLGSKRVYPGVQDEAVEFTAWDRTPGQINYLAEAARSGRLECDTAFGYAHIQLDGSSGIKPLGLVTVKEGKFVPLTP